MERASHEPSHDLPSAARGERHGSDAETLLSHPEALVDALASVLAARNTALDAEQAVRGLDALSEVEFHPMLAQAFGALGLGVAREALYPGEVERSARLRAKRAERERCDLVLLPSPGATLIDPVRRRMERDDAAQTLFASVAKEQPREEASIAPEDAFWLEVKIVGQFAYTNGWTGANSTYSSELARALADLPKIARDPSIHRGGLLLILFTRDRETGDHDLRVLAERASSRGEPMRSPVSARFPIADRIGNALCTLWLAPARCGSA